MKTIALPKVPRELRKLVPDKPLPSYREVYTAILNGHVPAEQQPNGRWRVDSDLTPIMQHFGLTT